MSQAGTLNNGGGGGTITFPITVPQGGTGQTFFPAHTVLLGEGTAPIGNVGPGAANTILMGTGAGTDPVFGTLVAGANITLTNGPGTITISSSGGAATNITFHDDLGTTATTNAGIINLIGTSTQGITVTGDGASTVTVNALSATTAQRGTIVLASNAQAIAGTDTVNAITSASLAAKLGPQTTHGVLLGEGSTAAIGATAAGAANTALLGQGAGADPIFGAIPNATLQNSSVTLNSGNNITVTGGGPLALGGTASFNVTGTTNHAVQVGTAAGALNSIPVGTSGQVLVGSTGADPVFATLTSPDNSILFTMGAGSLALKANPANVIETLTGNTGPAVVPTAGNIFVVGDGSAASGLTFSGAGSTLTGTVQTATTTLLGVTQLATNANTIAGTSTTVVNTPASLAAKLGSQTLNGIAFGQGTTSAIGWTAAGTTGQVLTATTGNAPTWQTPAAVALTITGDSGGALSPTANNWNILGQQAGTVAVMDTIGSVSTLKIEDRTWTTSFVVDPSSTVGLRGTFSTIQSAINAAVSGQTIFIRDGTYTEDLSLKGGVNLTAFGSDSSLFSGTGNVNIIGKMSITSAGTVSLYGLTLQTNSDFLLSVGGIPTIVININNCTLRITNHTGIQFTNSNTNSNINVWYSTVVITADNIAHFTHSGAGGLYFLYTHMQGLGAGASSSSTISQGSVTFDQCVANLSVTSSGTGGVTAFGCYIDGSSVNKTNFIIGGSGASIRNCSLSSGSADSIVANANTLIYNCSIFSNSATAAISGSASVNVNQILLGGTQTKITAPRSSPGVFLGAAQGTTAGVANLATVNIYTANPSEMYLVSCQANGGSAIRASAFVSFDASSTITADNIAASGCNISVSGSTISIHNTAGGSLTFNWSVMRLY